MVSIVFYFQVHQPYRIKKYSVFDIGDGNYFNSKTDNRNNERVCKKVSKKCYLPSNKVFLNLLKNHPEFKISYSISGVALEQFEKYSPKVIESFQNLYDTGRVELLNETYHHSLSFVESKEEFLEQVKLHRKKIYEVFGAKPKVFRNTELLYNDEVSKIISKLGFKTTLAEGWDKVLGWRSPNFVYKAKNSDVNLLFRNYKLSDDIGFRFSSKSWNEWPLTSEKYSKWINSINGNGEVVNLFLDYETFGEHQWSETGVFDFLKKLPQNLLKHESNDFLTPSEAVKKYEVREEISVPNIVTWADTERDLSAWTGNEMQQNALRKVFELENSVKSSENGDLINSWRKLTTSDHFYYMCTKWFNDGDVHKYFSPFETPYEAYFSFMNVLKDFKKRL